MVGNVGAPVGDVGGRERGGGFHSRAPKDDVVVWNAKSIIAANCYGNSPLCFMTPKEYGEKYPDHLLEQYKLYVEMADRISQRRDQSNKFYATVYSALAAVLLLAARFDLSDSTLGIVFLAVGIVGSALAFIWWLNIQSYRALNRAKFAVIQEMEASLPFPGYKKEWELLRPAQGKPKYLQLTRIEQYIPVVFLLMSMALVGYAAYTLAGS